MIWRTCLSPIPAPATTSPSEDGAHVARRSLFTHMDRRRLPRLPGSGYPQGRALHDSQADFHTLARCRELDSVELAKLGNISPKPTYGPKQFIVARHPSTEDLNVPTGQPALWLRCQSKYDADNLSDRDAS